MIDVEDCAAWSEGAIARLEECMVAVFTAPEGQEVLDYLRKITIGRVLPPEAGDRALRYLEGQRALVAIIDMRIANGRERKHRTAAGNPDGNTPARQRRGWRTTVQPTG